MNYDIQFERLFWELVALCDTASKAYAAAVFVEEFNDPRTSVRRRNKIILALLTCYRLGQEAGWCFAVLRLVLFPRLALLEQTSVNTLSEVLSAFWQSCEEFKFFRPVKNAANCLRNMTDYRMGAEARGAFKQTKLAKKVHKQAKLFSLGKLLSGVLADFVEIEREDAKEILVDWDCGGWVPPGDGDDLLERACPEKKNHSPAERQRQTRAKARFKAKVQSQKNPK
jgi:hypothetical protein